MASKEGYTQERVHLDCPEGEWKKHRTTGEDIKIGQKRSLYITKDGSFRSVGKICLNCHRVWIDGKLLGKVNTITSEGRESFGSRVIDALSSLRDMIGP